MDVILQSPSGQRTRATLGGSTGSVGSQGEVRAVTEVPRAVAKLVRNPAAFQLKERLDILFGTVPRDLVARGPVVRLAWPIGRVLRPRDDALIGYLQPRLGLPGFVPLREAFHDEVRLRLMPRITWEWFLALAADLADTVRLVGSHGHVIGDLAPENLFVTADAHVAVVDVDGWQLTRADGEPLRCPFSRPEYTAPEHLTSLADCPLREPASDWWALAVLVAQLLCLGCHPFAGIPADADPPYEEAVNVRARRCWLTGSALAVPPGTPPAWFLPSSLRDLFADCFEAGYDHPERRPRPERWAAALRKTRAELSGCQAQPSHRYARELTRCPWCAIAEAGGPDRFPVPAPSAQPGGGSDDRG